MRRMRTAPFGESGKLWHFSAHMMVGLVMWAIIIDTVHWLAVTLF